MEGPAGEEHEARLNRIICLQVYSGPFSWVSWERLKIVSWVVPLPSAASMAGFIWAVVAHFNLGKLKSLHIFRSACLEWSILYATGISGHFSKE